MATDTLEEKAVYPCEPATEEELLDAIQSASFGLRGDCEKLRRMTVKIPTGQISWSSVHTLCVLGRADSLCNASLEKAGFKSGVYVNHGGGWLILIHPEESDIQVYADHCKTRLQFLGLYRTMLPELVLPSLTALKRLQVWYNEELSSINGLAQSTLLTELDLSECSSLTALHGLENLTQLTRLDLSGFSNLTALPALDNLTQLTNLNLSRCSSLTALPALENLTQLTSLDLSRCSSLTALHGLENLTQLTYLNLSGCSSLTALHGLENLTQLTKLYLTQCRSLTALPALDNLTQLTKLDLSGCSSLTALHGLEYLTQLTDLNLSGCSSLTALHGLEYLTQLTDLNLSGCGISELPAWIRSMESLRELDLCHLKLRELPDWLPEIAEGFSLKAYGWQSGKNKAIVYLGGTTVEDIPDMSIFEQSYEMVVEWFKNRDKVPLNEIKVVFLGDGEAGKSHTIARLMNDGGDPVDYTDQSTPGIVIRNKDYTLDGRTFWVHYWDFGGQEIMHSMHRIFLTRRTMYVILLNARDDTQSDRAKYWLHNVKSFAPDAPVLLVLNKIDQNENASVDERDLRGRYEKLTQVVKLSALKYSQEEFNKRFTDKLLEEIQKTGYLDAQWPISWTQVKGKLENMTSHYIMGDAYQDICAAYGVDRSQKDLLHWFNDLGVSFCCCDKEDYALEDYVILRPDWITNALYIILFNPLEDAQNGRIPHKSIYQLLRTVHLRNAHGKAVVRCTMPEARYNSSDIQYVLGVMRKFNLSFADGNDHEFIPMLCQQNSTVDVQYYRKDAEILEFNMEFDYLPNNLLHRLMVERNTELDMNNVWRTGARFILPGTGLIAVVVIDGNTLRFFIRHTDPMHRPNTYLTMLKANVDRIVGKMGLKAPSCKLVYKLDGKANAFDFNILKLQMQLGQTHAVSEAHQRLIPITDILNQSAPEGLEDEQKLLDAITKACRQIQAEPDYCLKNGESGRGMENKRNRRIRDVLELLGYDVKDQTQRGLSGTGKGIGELDMLVYNDSNEPWTIIEALCVSGKGKSYWDKHLDKLSVNYNTSGFPALYLLTYVDADISTFPQLWKSYREYIQTHDPSQRKYLGGSFVNVDVPNSQYIKVGKCRYSSGDDSITVYHIFVRIPTQNG